MIFGSPARLGITGLRSTARRPSTVGRMLALYIDDVGSIPGLPEMIPECKARNKS